MPNAQIGQQKVNILKKTTVLCLTGSYYSMLHMYCTVYTHTRTHTPCLEVGCRVHDTHGPYIIPKFLVSHNYSVNCHRFMKFIQCV